MQDCSLLLAWLFLVIYNLFYLNILSVSGQVKTVSGELIPGVTITIYSASTELGNVLSDASGKFLL